jgi:uncharacterized protein (TIGR03437 family)
LDAFEEANRAVQKFADTRAAKVLSEVRTSGYVFPEGVLALGASDAAGEDRRDAVWTQGSLAKLDTGMYLREEAAAGLPPPMEMQGLTVRVAGQLAPLLSCRDKGVLLQVPWGVPCGPQTVSLERGGVTIGRIMAEIRPNHPTILAVSDLSWQPIDEKRPAFAGSIVVVFATGLGSPETPPDTGQPAPANSVVKARCAVAAEIDGRPATILFAGLAPGLVGVQQIVIQLPDQVRNVEARAVLTADGVPGPAFVIPIR